MERLSFLDYSKKIFLFTFIMAVSHVLMAQCPNNLLSNPGFENGFQNWTALNQASLDTDANTGTQAVRIAPNDTEWKLRYDWYKISE